MQAQGRVMAGSLWEACVHNLDTNKELAREAELLQKIAAKRDEAR